MKNDLQREIIRALSVSQAITNTPEGLRRFSSRQWKSGLPWLRHSALELLLDESLKFAGGDPFVPPDVRVLMRQDASRNKERFKVMRGEFEILIGMFKQSEVPFAVLKGFSLVPDFCPSPELRNQYDFDFIIDRENLLPVDEVLRQAGFVPKHAERVVNPVIYYHSQRKPLPPSTLTGIFSSELHRSVEVHTSIWESGTEGLNIEWPGDALRRSLHKGWKGLDFPVLATEDALLFQVLHIFRHILNNWCRLSWFYEIAVFLKHRSNDEPFWLGFSRLICDQIRLAQCVGIVFELTARLFEADIPAAIEPFSVDTLTPSMRLWVTRYGIRSAIQNFSGDKYSLLLHELFVDDPRLWLEFRSRRLRPRNRPHAIININGQRGSRLWWARGQQAVHSLRRLGFHSLTGLKYVMALPFWSVEKRKLSRGDCTKHRSHAVWVGTANAGRERAIDAREADV